MSANTPKIRECEGCYQDYELEEAEFRCQTADPEKYCSDVCADKDKAEMGTGSTLVPYGERTVEL